MIQLEIYTLEIQYIFALALLNEINTKYNKQKTISTITTNFNIKLHQQQQQIGKTCLLKTQAIK